AAVPVAHQHRLDRVAVCCAEERLDRPVLRHCLVLDRQSRERHLLGERVAQRPRQIRHLVVAGCPARRPFPHLAGAEGGLVECGEGLVEELEIHTGRVAPCSRRSRASSSFPLASAVWSGTFSPLSTPFGSAPASSRISTASSCPAKTAVPSGRTRANDASARRSSGAPRSTRSRTASAPPAKQARWSG